MGHPLLERCVANGKCVLKALQDSHSLLSVFHNHCIRHTGPLLITVPCQETATRNNHSWHWMFNNSLRGILPPPCCVEISQFTIYEVRQHATQRDKKGFHLIGCDGAKVVCSQSRVLCRLVLSPFPCTQQAKETHNRKPVDTRKAARDANTLRRLSPAQIFLGSTARCVPLPSPPRYPA